MVLLSALTAGVLFAAAPTAGSAVSAASPRNAQTQVSASLSSSGGAVGDPVVLALDLIGGDDVYAATVSVRYDAERIALDTDRVTSEFPGMYSVSGVAGAIEVTVTRLGTSSGRAGDLPLASLGFVATAPGEGLLRVSEVSVVDSALARITRSPGIAVVYAVTGATPPATPSSEPAPSPVSVTGYGPGPTRSGGETEVGAAPQSSAAPTHRPARIDASSLSPRAGDDLRLSVSGVAANTVHRVALLPGSLPLGEAMSDAAGAFVLQTTIPADAPLGAHEIVVTRDGVPVASLPVTIRAAEDAASPSSSSTSTSPAPAAGEGADGSATTALDAVATTSGDSPAGAIAVAVIVAAVLALAATVLVRRRAHRAGGTVGRSASAETAPERGRP